MRTRGMGVGPGPPNAGPLGSLISPGFGLVSPSPPSVIVSTTVLPEIVTLLVQSTQVPLMFFQYFASPGKAAG